MKQTLVLKQTFLLAAISALLSACGGGGGGSDGNSANAGQNNSTIALANQCAAPRPGTVDRQGSADTEKAYLKAFVNDTYLWYQDVPANINPASYATPQAYFDVLKTPKLTASGKPVDQFHWSQTTASWQAQSQGIAQDYGIQWAAQASAPPRNWIVAEVAAGSPADKAGIKRGDRLLAVDGVDFVNDATSTGVAKINEALFPSVLAAHQLTFSGKTAISLTPATYSVATVSKVKVIPTLTGNVGYFVFDQHIAQSETELLNAISQLKAQNVTDLVIDLRYNGGGLLYVASELAYMIAGPGPTSGKIFEQLTYNDKLTALNKQYPFYNTAVNGTSLPNLGLNKVTLLVSQGTASASESLINSLRGVDVTVNLIGNTTRGKPYGFVPQDNCGYTYFAIQFKGVNQKGFGDYPDGFAATCAVADDFTRQRGDTTESMLSAALSYRQTGVCPSNVARAMPAALTDFTLVRPLSKEMRLLSPSVAR